MRQLNKRAYCARVGLRHCRIHRSLGAAMPTCNIIREGLGQHTRQHVNVKACIALLFGLRTPHLHRKSVIPILQSEKTLHKCFSKG